MFQSRSILTPVLLAFVSLLPYSGYATTPVATSVSFSRSDLNAFIALVKPELTSIRVHDLRGEFRPGPSLIFAGLEPENFDLKIDGAGLADLRFNELRAKAPTLQFEAGRLRVDVPFDDQPKAIRSRLGSISMKGVTITAWVKFARNSTALVFDGAALTGELKGSGLLKPKWVIKAIHDMALGKMRSLIERSISKPNVQASLEKGLLTWAKFSRDERLSRVMPGTISVNTAGIRYEAE